VVKDVDVPGEEVLDPGIVGLCGSVGHDLLVDSRLAFGGSRQLHFATQHQLAMMVKEAQVLALAPGRAGTEALYPRFVEWIVRRILADKMIDRACYLGAEIDFMDSRFRTGHNCAFLGKVRYNEDNRPTLW